MHRLLAAQPGAYPDSLTDCCAKKRTAAEKGWAGAVPECSNDRQDEIGAATDRQGMAGALGTSVRVETEANDVNEVVDHQNCTHHTVDDNTPRAGSKHHE